MTQISVRRAATRERLGDAALEVFAERGILAASVEEICERAGFTRGAFYSNYSSKDDLCSELLRRICDVKIQTSLSGIERLANQARGADIEWFAEKAADIFALLHDDDQTVMLFLGEVELYAARSATFAEHYRAFDTECRGAFAEVMRTAVDHVDLEWAVPEPDAADLLALVQHQLNSICMLGGTFDRDRLLRTLRPLMHGLLVPRPGGTEPAREDH